MSEVFQRRQIFRLSRERRVADIMEAAKAVFLEHGYDAALISEIAARADVVEGTIYRYFENKRDLMIKVVERWYDEMLADFDEQLKGITGTWNRLRFMIWKHLSSISKEPALCRLVFQELRPGPEYRSTTVFELNREYTRRTLEIVEAAMESGEFRKDVPLRIVRDMIFGCVEHHTWAFLRGHGTINADEAADAITEIIYRGLAVQPKAMAQPSLNEVIMERLERVTARLEALEAGRCGSAN
ncbi:TetR/AcrR family transcriptional regulator [Rhodoligotrophos defluvii]|uniref:TetR/AcrR family transcriptional regulator n=1 Tax=Rhodoligotrophos defluvii TaxID=2561934 RepID=UPI0010C99BEC|nr:TetR/AcrR family transcriptional regulator [Rhodoligotrophos defluvii]